MDFNNSHAPDLYLNEYVNFRCTISHYVGDLDAYIRLIMSGTSPQSWSLRSGCAITRLRVFNELITKGFSPTIDDTYCAQRVKMNPYVIEVSVQVSPALDNHGIDCIAGDDAISGTIESRRTEFKDLKSM